MAGNYYRNLRMKETSPPCVFTHLTGIIVTIGGMPVDLGLPGDLNLDAIKNAGLLEL